MGAFHTCDRCCSRIHLKHVSLTTHSKLKHEVRLKSKLALHFKPEVIADTYWFKTPLDQSNHCHCHLLSP